MCQVKKTAEGVTVWERVRARGWKGGSGKSRNEGRKGQRDVGDVTCCIFSTTVGILQLHDLADPRASPAVDRRLTDMGSLSKVMENVFTLIRLLHLR